MPTPDPNNDEEAYATNSGIANASWEEASALFRRPEIEAKLRAGANGRQYALIGKLLAYEHRKYRSENGGNVQYDIRELALKAGVNAIRQGWKHNTADPSQEMSTWIIVIATMTLCDEWLKMNNKTVTDLR